MFGNFAKLDSPRRLVQFWQNFQTSLVLLIPNCTRQRMITYTNIMLFKRSCIPKEKHAQIEYCEEQDKRHLKLHGIMYYYL